MALNRSHSIISRIKLFSGGFDNQKITEDHLFHLIDLMQQRLAEDYLCIESSMTLPVVSGTGEYDLTLNGANQSGFYRMKFLSPPTGTTLIPVEIDLPTAEELTRLAFTNTGLNVLYYRIWDRQLQFVPTPSGTANWTLWYYKTPTTNASRSVEPETPREFDNAIVYGVIQEITPNEGNVFRYQNELSRVLNGWRRTKSSGNQIAYHDL